MTASEREPTDEQVKAAMDVLASIDFADRAEAWR